MIVKLRIDHMLPLNDLCVAAPMDPLAVSMDDLELSLGVSFEALKMMALLSTIFKVLIYCRPLYMHIFKLLIFIFIIPVWVSCR